MTCKVSCICDFLFGSFRTTLPTDTVDVEMTVQTVKGIYMYRKDCTMESMTFTLWSKKVTPFPSLRCKIQVYKDEQKEHKVLQWTNAFQFSTSLDSQNTLSNLRKRNPGKIRARR